MPRASSPSRNSRTRTARAGVLVAAGWLPWTYPVALFAVGLIGWGFVALLRSRRTTPAPSALVDTQGLLMHAIVHAANVQDRDGGVWLMVVLFARYPFLVKLYADGGYQGPQFRRAIKKILRRVNLEIVKRSDQAKGFVVLPKRWIVAARTMLPI